MSNPPSGPCTNCNVRPATQWWVADGGVMSFVHGCGQAWCERCCVTEQIRYAEEAAARLPDLRLRLLALTPPSEGRK